MTTTSVAIKHLTLSDYTEVVWNPWEFFGKTSFVTQQDTYVAHPVGAQQGYATRKEADAKAEALGLSDAVAPGSVVDIYVVTVEFDGDFETTYRHFVVGPTEINLFEEYDLVSEEEQAAYDEADEYDEFHSTDPGLAMAVDIPWGTPDSWIPDNPNDDGFTRSDFI